MEVDNQLMDDVDDIEANIKQEEQFRLLQQEEERQK